MENLKPWQIPDEQWMQFRSNKRLAVGNIMLTLPKMNQIGEIATLLQGEQALVPVDPKEITDSIAQELSLVAVDSSRENKVVGYQSIGIWRDDKLLELRSAKVLPEYRGGGVNTLMKKLAIKMGIEKFPDWFFLGFTEFESKSRGILLKLGFQEIPLERVKEEFYNLSTICPAACYIKEGHVCGCKVYILNPYE